MKPSLTLVFLIPLLLGAQNPSHYFPQSDIDRALSVATGIVPEPLSDYSAANYPSGVKQLLNLYRPGHFNIALPSFSQQISRSSDTLIVGVAGNDTLVINGNWQNNGPIYVMNSGVLIFENAQATILGNIYVVDAGQLIASNSLLYIPQQYFYQRALITAGQGAVTIQNSTLNFGGMSHNFSLLDSSTIRLQNVYFTDWTTTGTSGKPVFSIDTCNVLGEIIVSDSATVSIANTDTVLLWYHVPRQTQLVGSFPNGINLSHYSFTPSSPGVSGLRYNVEADNIKLAWWALMPEDGSNVSINNSSLRSIGAWFTGNDSTTVSGLVDKATYTSSGNLFSDRTLILDSTSVTTWSLYPMDSSVVTINGCVAGEIGSSEGSRTLCNSTFVDGSGGYFWATGSAVQFATFCAFTSNVRSEGNSILLAANSSIADGATSGIENSLLLLVQTPVLQQPVANDGSDVWVAQISAPATANVNDLVNIPGSAYILRGPSSLLMSFDHYYLSYEPSGSLAAKLITGNIYSPVDQGSLATWNTTGLTPGAYNVMLTLKDNWGDSVVGTTAVNLLPAAIAGINALNEEVVQLFPNPAVNRFSVQFPSATFNLLTITDLTGKLMEQSIIPQAEVREDFPVTDFATGIYLLKLSGIDGSVTKKLVIER